MSQTLLPPPAQPGSDPETPGSVAVVDSIPPGAQRAPSAHAGYAPEPPRQPSRLWRAIKWPLRQILKALYLTGSAANRPRAAALVILALVLVLSGGSYAVYQFTRPAQTPAPQAERTPRAALSNGVDTPFTISPGQTLPLPSSVISFLHAWKIGDVKEVESALAPDAVSAGAIFGGQGGVIPEEGWASLFQSAQSQGVLFQQFVYTGGFIDPTNHTGIYTVQAVAGFQGQTAIAVFSWYFVVGTDGQIIEWLDLTTAPQAAATP